MPMPANFARGRGAVSNATGRYESQVHEAFDDGWTVEDPAPEQLTTTVQPEKARRIITTNDSPDIGFDQSINPYRGCEHGCIYCYARPSHAYVDLSPGLDFETKLFYKQDAAARLAETFRKPGYRPSPITLGANTDGYQPIEREHGVTRSILEVMRDFRHPLTIITKSALVLKDLDVLTELAASDLVQVMVSITSLDPRIKRTLEPRAAGPAARLRAVRELCAAGVPTGVMIAPVIPAITDHEIEHIVAAAADAGAERVGYVMLRLPYEVKTLFREWLDEHYPQRAAHVMSLVQAVRGGRDNDPRFGTRMRGEGAFAELIARRFRVACRRYGLPRSPARPLRTDLVAPPARAGDQLDLLRFE